MALNIFGGLGGLIGLFGRKKKMNNFNQISLPVIAAAFLKGNGTFVAAGCEVVKGSTGAWRIILPQEFPLGEYLAVATVMNGAQAAVHAFDGDAINKFVDTYLLDGTAADLDASVIYYALPIPLPASE